MMMRSNHFKYQRGSISLVTSLLLLSALSSVVLFTTKSASLDQKILANDMRVKAAFSAAEAGIEFGMMYLEKNASTIIVDTNSSGYIDTYTNNATTNVALSDGSSYSVTFSNPVANNFDLITVNSTGTSADGTTTKSLEQVVKKFSVLQSAPPTPLTTKGNINLGGNITISNTVTDVTIWSGGSVSLTGSASTETSGGTASDKNTIGVDVAQNDGNLAAATADEFFENFFGKSKATVKSMSTSVYTNSGATSMNGALNGKTGEIIWIEQQSGAATLNSNTVIGSPDNPVILIINGEAKINGGATIYGVVYIASDWNNSGGGNSEVNGAVIVEGVYSAQGTPDMNYDDTILRNIDVKLGSFSKVPGGWTDL